MYYTESCFWKLTKISYLFPDYWCKDLLSLVWETLPTFFINPKLLIFALFYIFF